MNRLIHLNKAAAVFLVVLAFGCFCFSPLAQAVSPPPDGGYPNKNTAEGDQALFSLTTGNSNTATGYQALQNNTTGPHNTASGVWALRNNTAGADNTASGYEALFNNTTGLFNTANGSQALLSNTTGINNTATGESALQRNTTGLGNTANGSEALVANTSGERNTAIGFDSLEKNTTGSFNVALGAGAGSNVITADDVICIGRAVDGVNVSGTCFIGNIRGVQTQNANALPVVIDGAGQLGTVASSERFKKDIAIMGQASEGILSLRPVTFHYKTDGTSTPQFGLIAEEVAKVNPALVLPDKEGKPYTVRYDAVNAMLLNEFLKEHCKVESLEKAMVEQQKENAAMRAMLKEQAAQIQKVSAQLELHKAAPQTVLNNQ
jgi:Chaperone of endosialidase